MMMIPFFSFFAPGRGRVLTSAFLMTLAVVKSVPAQSDTTLPAPTLASGKEYVLAHGSSFNAPPATARNPFWPIGWVPTAAPVGVAAVVQYDVKAENFVVTSISVDAPALAVVNGKTYGVGEHIPVSADGREFVTVKQIADGMVVLDHRGRELRVMSSAGVRRAK